PEEADGDGVHTLRDELPDRGLGFFFVQLHDDLALAVDALADLGDVGLRHDRIGFAALGEVENLGVVEAGHAARAAHDVDDVTMPLRRDQPDLRAAALQHGVRPAGR